VDPKEISGQRRNPRGSPKKKKRCRAAGAQDRRKKAWGIGAANLRTAKGKGQGTARTRTRGGHALPFFGGGGGKKFGTRNLRCEKKLLPGIKNPPPKDSYQKWQKQKNNAWYRVKPVRQTHQKKGGKTAQAERLKPQVTGKKKPIVAQGKGKIIRLFQKSHSWGGRAKRHRVERKTGTCLFPPRPVRNTDAGGKRGRQSLPLPENQNISPDGGQSISLHTRR